MANKVMDASSATSRVEKRILTMRINAMSRMARYLSDDNRRRVSTADTKINDQLCCGSQISLFLFTGFIKMLVDDDLVVQNRGGIGKMTVELDVSIDQSEQAKESEQPWIMMFNKFHDERLYVVDLPIRKSGDVSTLGVAFHPSSPLDEDRLLAWNAQAEAFARSFGFRSVAKLVEFYIDQARRWGEYGVLHGDPFCTRYPPYFVG